MIDLFQRESPLNVDIQNSKQDIRNKDAEGGDKMSIYTTLWTFTDEGVKAMKDIPDISQRVSRVCTENGGTLRDMFLCLGEYDAIALIETPDDSALYRIMTEITSWGYAHTQTIKCLPVTEYAAALRKAA